MERQTGGRDTIGLDRITFVLFAQARSGSTVLCRVLQLHPQLRVALEPFCDKYQLWSPGEPKYIDLIHDIPSLKEQLTALYARTSNNLLPNAKIIDEQFGSDNTGWLFGNEQGVSNG